MATLSGQEVGFDLHGVMHSATKMAATQAAAKDLRTALTLDAAVPRVLLGDPHRLRQVMTNLLANSIKFTTKGGVHLRANLKRTIYISYARCMNPVFPCHASSERSPA